MTDADSGPDVTFVRVTAEVGVEHTTIISFEVQIVKKDTVIMVKAGEVEVVGLTCLGISETWCAL